MSNLHALRFLIEAAGRERDDAARASARARTEAQSADATRRMLHDYRAELRGRAPALRDDGFDPALIHQFGAFSRRLDGAVTEQDRTAARFERIADDRQRELVAQQRRLRSLEALVERRLAQRAAAEQRAEQKRTDEFAARAGRAVGGGGTGGRR